MAFGSRIITGHGDKIFRFFSEKALDNVLLLQYIISKLVLSGVNSTPGKIMRISYQKTESEQLEAMLPHIDLLADSVSVKALEKIPGSRDVIVSRPTPDFLFLHEAAVIGYHGILFASWYNCAVGELHGYTPIRGAKSFDGGKTWTEPEVIASDPSGKLLYCPPVYGICDDTLYLLCNTMVGADHMHSLEFYRYDEASGKFLFLRSEPLPFKLNTNVYTLPNGKLLLPGRIAEMDSFPNTPAVLISDSGKIDAPWRLVKIQQNGALPDGSSLLHPELSAIVQEDLITIFCRDDRREVPLLYQSHDRGETWCGPISHNIPFCGSKIYSGTLSNGVNYVVGSMDDRDRLSIFFSKPGSLEFIRGYDIQNGYNPVLNLSPQFSYPVGCEMNGFLHIIYTMQIPPQKNNIRGAMLTSIPVRDK